MSGVNKRTLATFEHMRLPDLQRSFQELTGEQTRCPNRKFLMKRIMQALEERVSHPQATAAPSSPASSAERAQKSKVGESIEDLQARYAAVIGRSTSSADRRYLLWKLGEAEKGRVRKGAPITRAREAMPEAAVVLPLRLESRAVLAMDEVWRGRSLKNRSDFLRRAIGHYLTHLGASEAAQHFVR